MQGSPTFSRTDLGATLSTANIDNSSKNPKASDEKLADSNHLQQMTDYAKDVADTKQSNRKNLVTSGSYFSGGGLLEEGLKGIINPQVAVEFNEKIAGVYADNHGNHIVTADVRNVDPNELVGHIDGEVQYFHASPVCKNFSTAKRNAEEIGIDVETAQSTADFIHKIRPKVVTIENAKGYRRGKSLEIILQALKDEEYRYDVNVYNAADFGGYTKRERLIVRAVRDGELPEKPKPLDARLRPKGWMDAVDDLIDSLPERKGGVPAWMDTRLKAEGIDWHSIDKPLYVFGQGNSFTSVPHAYADELLPTLRTGGGDVIIMPDGRVLKVTPRILARVTGLSDDYKMPQTDTLAHIVIGNGIPTQLTRGVIAPLLRSVFNEDTNIKKHIGENVDFSVREEDSEELSLKDNQGNPMNADGTLKLDKIHSVDELTDKDFLNPTRNIQLPSLPKKIADVIGTNGKSVIIKKNIFERNYLHHGDVTPEQSKAIFNAALYNPDLYGQNQKTNRPYNWVLINTKDEKGKNRTVLLEINSNKDNVEIVHWHFVDKKGLDKLKRQAIREDGQLLILPSEQSKEAGALSSLTDALSTAKIDSSFDNTKASEEKVNLQQMTNYAHDVAEALNVKGDVEVVTSEGLKGKTKQAKGWYDPKTGKITIVADNHTNAADIEQKMLHEAVAHKGLRALFGERFTTFLDNVFTNADVEVRHGITE